MRSVEGHKSGGLGMGGCGDGTRLEATEENQKYISCPRMLSWKRVVRVTDSEPDFEMSTGQQ